MAELPSHTQNGMIEASKGVSPNARFLAGDVPTAKTPLKRLGSSIGVSLLSHVGVFLLMLFVVTRLPAVTEIAAQMAMPKDIIWLAQPGPGGGGGGGGNRTPEPPRKVELPGKEKITVPVAKPPTPEPKESKIENPLTIPAQPMAAAVDILPGAISPLPSATISLGPGSGGGSGTGTGTGMGPGTGSGLGPGTGGGTGGGLYHPGNGVTSPKLIKEIKPTYTGEAMRAKIQGIVTMEAVVMPDGSVGNVHITRSLDDRFGLDQEAIRTVKQWRFSPGLKLGVPVMVLVEIEMQFTLR